MANHIQPGKIVLNCRSGCHAIGPGGAAKDRSRAAIRPRGAVGKCELPWWTPYCTLVSQSQGCRPFPGHCIRPPRRCSCGGTIFRPWPVSVKALRIGCRCQGWMVLPVAACCPACKGLLVGAGTTPFLAVLAGKNVCPRPALPGLGAWAFSWASNSCAVAVLRWRGPSR